MNVYLTSTDAIGKIPSMNPKKQLRFADEIREAVNQSGLTPYRICKETGIDQGQMSRFLAGRMWLGEETMNRLAEFLKLRVVVRKGK